MRDFGIRVWDHLGEFLAIEVIEIQESKPGGGVETLNLEATSGGLCGAEPKPYYMSARLHPTIATGQVIGATSVSKLTSHGPDKTLHIITKS